MRGQAGIKALTADARQGDEQAIERLARLWPSALSNEGERLSAGAMGAVLRGLADHACATPGCSEKMGEQLRGLLWSQSALLADNETLRSQLFQVLAKVLGGYPEGSRQASTVRDDVATWVESHALASGGLDWLTAQSVVFAADPEKLFALWEGGDVSTAERIASVLAAADPIYWVFLAQNLVDLSGSTDVAVGWPIAGAQARAISLPKASGARASSGLAVDSELVTNPFVASYAQGPDAPPMIAKRLLGMMSRADLQSDAVDSATVVGPRLGGFLRWALARMVERHDGACDAGLPDPLIGLDDSHPAIRAGQASLVVAIVQARSSGGC